jgi:hypothetical protein
VEETDLLREEDRARFLEQARAYRIYRTVTPPRSVSP